MIDRTGGWEPGIRDVGKRLWGSGVPPSVCSDGQKPPWLQWLFCKQPAMQLPEQERQCRQPASGRGHRHRSAGTRLTSPPAGPGTRCSPRPWWQPRPSASRGRRGSTGCSRPRCSCLPTHSDGQTGAHTGYTHLHSNRGATTLRRSLVTTAGTPPENATHGHEHWRLGETVAAATFSEPRCKYRGQCSSHVWGPRPWNTATRTTWRNTLLTVIKSHLFSNLCNAPLSSMWVNTEVTQYLVNSLYLDIILKLMLPLKSHISFLDKDEPSRQCRCGY